MMVVFTITEIHYLVVSLFFDLVWAILYLFVILSSLTALFTLFLA